MTVKFISAKCPECNALLNIENDRDIAYCTYCGAKIILHNENEYVFRDVDEASIKQSETERIIRMRQMDLIQEKRRTKNKRRKVTLITALIMAVTGIALMPISSIIGADVGDSLESASLFLIVIAMWVGLFGLIANDDDDDDDLILGDKAKVPESISGYKKKNYKAVEEMFRSAGFTNVKCVGLKDLKLGLLQKPGLVDSITINGHSVYSGGKKYLKDAAIVISYHSL